MMNPNPVLRKLGFSDTDRLVIIHTDDIGMCQASLTAFADLWDFGTISSGAVMVPCPWFPATAAYCRERPGVDMGVHATLNSEWDSYRWGPISTRDPETGLLDDEGYFHRRQPAVQEKADVESVRIELQAQVARALGAGIDVTHVDTHMAAVAHPRFVSVYLQAGMQAGIPVMIPRLDVAGYQAVGLDSETATAVVALVHRLEEQGLPLVDAVGGLPLDQPDGQLEMAKKMLNELKPGITHFVIHPSVDTPELRAITPDWLSRVANYQTFISQEMKTFLGNAGIQLIGYHHLRALMRK